MPCSFLRGSSSSQIMSEHAQTSAVLYCHPDTPCTVVESIESSIRCELGNVLTVTYKLKGVVEQLRIPPDGSTRRADGLWQRTCFELFIGAKNDAEYYEFDFSPSGEWQAYEFRSYREGGLLQGDGLEPRIAVQRGADILELSVVFSLDFFPGIQSDLCLWVGLAAVVEDGNGQLSYWALKHPPGKPDFHHADAFALELALAGSKI
jgi:hypothetical protein